MSPNSFGTPDSTTEGLRAQLARDGVVTVQQVVDEELLASIRAAIGTVLDGPGSADLLRADSGSVRKITYPLSLDRRFLTALAHPGLLGLAVAISPEPEQLVLTWEDVLHKAPRNGEAVPVHQDLAMQSLPGPVYSLGVHLDDAIENPIWFLLGSHRFGPQTAEQVKALGRRGGFVAVAPRAGDVVIHDALCVHRSDANTGSAPRSTWYLEFRTTRQLVADGRWPASWARQRRALLFHACAARAQQGLATVWPPLGPGESIDGWLREPMVLRVPHVSHGVEYDVASPWYHFA
jgi:ectoine hydroxylase-related dioxygenase (phytanoyl-CoA dioxygenase family)